MAVKSSFRNMTLCLLAICLLCSALLAGIYAVTAAPIRDAQAAKVQKAIAAVAPEFKEVSELDTVLVAGAPVTYYTLSTDESVVAYAVNVSEGGFGGPVSLMVGFTPDGVIYDVSVVDCSNETPGLGAKCVEPAFHDQFVKFNPAEKKLLVRKDGGDVDAITAATITSRAYTKAVSIAAEAFKLISAVSVPEAVENGLEVSGTPLAETIEGGE